jgi:chemotaxis protein methyltransferase CheR
MAANSSKISPANFQFIREIARETAAIVLDPGKEYLVETRLGPIAQQAAFASLDEFVDHMRKGRSATPFHDRVIDALTTNETSFFRDFHPFEALRTTILPQVIAERASQKRLRIWSAASSTGQEAYTLALLLREHFPQLRDWVVNIVGTDLSPTVIAQAREGSYSQLEVNRGLPAIYLVKYFEKKDSRWVLKPEVRQLVEFRQMNLAKPWPIMPLFDIVFLRNVMIYFDAEAKKTILKRLRACLNPAGYLFLGTGETTTSLDASFRSEMFGKSQVHRMNASELVAKAA